MLKEMFLLLLGSVSAFAVLEPAKFELTCVLGVAVGGGLWAGTAWVTRLWNRLFSLSVVQQLLCGLAAVFTAFCVVSFASLAEVHEVVGAVVAVWHSETDLLAGFAPTNAPDTRFAQDDARPADPAQWNAAPTAGDAQRLLLESFQSSHPFLARMLGDTPLPLSAAAGNGSASQFTPRTIAAVARAIADALAEHIDGIALRIRLTLLAALVLLQGAVIGSLAYAADRDLRPSL